MGTRTAWVMFCSVVALMTASVIATVSRNNYSKYEVDEIKAYIAGLKPTRFTKEDGDVVKAQIEDIKAQLAVTQKNSQDNHDILLRLVQPDRGGRGPGGPPPDERR